MSKTTTIKIDDRLHKAAVHLANEKLIRGGFSAYVEQLIIADLKKNNSMPSLKEGK